MSSCPDNPAIWGKPLFDLPTEITSAQLSRRGHTAPVRNQLRIFLSDQMADFQPDLIVLHERKGTAIVRTLLEHRSDPLLWPWKKIVSSTALDQLSADDIAGRRILVFDDMMRTGRHLQEIFSILSKLVGDATCDVRVAIFAMHQDAQVSGPVPGLNLTHAWFFRALSTHAYQRLRADIIKLLQEAGSLMLDTEHIELRLTLNGGFNKLVDALRRKASVIVFNSLGQRTNLTVYYGDDEAHQIDPSRFPSGVSFTDIVKKCRVVQRDGDEFAIIPICLPSVPVDSADWVISDEDNEILGDSHCRSGQARFYGAALIASLYPLFWILRDLYATDPRSFTISLPTCDRPPGSSEYTLDHLMVMYPTVNVSRLVQSIAALDRRARSEGAELHKIRVKRTKAPFVPDVNLHRDALRLLQTIANSLDVRRVMESSDSSLPNLEGWRTGLTIREIFDLGCRFGWHPAEISALFDILIDDGNLITRVEPCQHGQAVQWSRTFRPDGEVVTDLVRKYTAQWGLPDA